MKRNLIVALAALGLAWTGLAKEKVFILVAHPDDTLACAGTMFLMKDRFELHVMVLTHGERGNGQQGFLDGSTKAKRTKEEENAEAMVGATVHWGDEIDGECYPRPATCQQVAALMKELKPRAVIGMWPLDRHLDHAMAGATLLKALGIAGMREVIECYFMEQSYDTRTFVPAHYVDITDVMEEKRAYIRQYVSQNKDDSMCKLEMQDSYMRAQRCSSWLLRGCPKNGGAERFAVYDGKPQGCRCIFAELPPPKGWSSDWKDAKPSKYTPTGKSFNHCPGWGRYVAEDVVGGRYLALHGCNAGFGWIDLGGDTPCEIGYSRVNTCGQGRPTPPQMPRFRPILHPRRYKTNRRL